MLLYRMNRNNIENGISLGHLGAQTYEAIAHLFKHIYFKHMCVCWCESEQCIYGRMCVSSGFFESRPVLTDTSDVTTNDLLRFPFSH